MKSKKAICGYDISDGINLCRETKLNDAGHCKKHAPEYEPQHTPTPWEIKDGWEGEIMKDGHLLAKVYDSRKNEQKANAAFIVRAVNAYDSMKDQLMDSSKRICDLKDLNEELLAMAKHMLDLIADFSNGDKPPVDIRSRWTDFAKAIAKAEDK